MSRAASPTASAGLAAIDAVPAAASSAVRRLLEGPPRSGRVLAAFPTAVYVEVAVTTEPRVLALVTHEAVRLPVSLVLGGSRRDPLAPVQAGAYATIREGTVRVASLHAHAARWWDPAPKIGTVTAQGLRDRLTELHALLDRAPTPPGLAGHAAPQALAAACAAGDLARDVDASERLVGFGPGLTPSGDDVLAGLLLSLRVLGNALPACSHAAMLADWIGAAATRDAHTRTTAIAATMLHCAAQGQAAAEVGTVLSALAGQERLQAAMRRLLAVGHTSGADLGWGLLAGGLAALRLGAR